MGDPDVPEEIRVETAEVNAGGKQPHHMKDIQVEFGVWKTTKGKYKAYNMTLPGGEPLLREALENRDVIMASTVFRGTIDLWFFKHHYGYITPAPGTKLPPEVQQKVEEMNKATQAKGKTVE